MSKKKKTPPLVYPTGQPVGAGDHQERQPEFAAQEMHVLKVVSAGLPDRKVFVIGHYPIAVESRQLAALAMEWVTTLSAIIRPHEHQFTVPRTAQARAARGIVPPGPRGNVSASLRAKTARRSASSDATYDGAGPVPPRRGCQ